MSPLTKTLLIFLPIIVVLAIIGPKYPEETESIAQKMGISEAECERRMWNMQRQFIPPISTLGETKRACSFQTSKSMTTNEAIEAYGKSRR